MNPILTPVFFSVEPFIHPFHFFWHNYTVAKQLAIDPGINEDGTAPVGKLSQIPLTLTPLWQPINKPMSSMSKQSLQQDQKVLTPQIYLQTRFTLKKQKHFCVLNINGVHLYYFGPFFRTQNVL